MWVGTEIWGSFLEEVVPEVNRLGEPVWREGKRKHLKGKK